MNNQNGQAVLIILLTMVVALTVVLSVIAGTTSDIKLSTNETSSLRAFSAAESGIEKALVTNSASSGSVNNANFTAVVAGLSQGTKNYNYPIDLVTGDSGVVWFVSHNSDGTLGCGTCFTGHIINICWGKPGTSASSATTPALEISTFYLNTPGDYTTVRVAKDIFDPYTTRPGTKNSYDAIDAGTCTIGSTNYAFQKQVDLATLGIGSGSYGVVNGLQFMPVKMLYNSDIPQPFGISVNFAGNSTLPNTLPSQGNLVDSTGSLNQATRKVEVTRAYNMAPPPFDAAVFSPNTLSQ